jgi:SAM-dependent methyltransferase
MPGIAAEGPNAQQIQYWNDVAGPRWVKLHDLIDDQIRPLGSLAMDRARVAPGERVLDIGCGCGDSTIELAQRVAPSGTVTGLDISAPMLERARQRASAQGSSARFELADVQAQAFPPASADLLFSRFGVMFFSDPTAAFANLRRALVPGGRLVFVCWQSLPDNPWMFVPLGAALQHMPPPPLPGPDAPGPFSFADPERVRAILTGAGFRAVTLDDTRQTLRIGAGGSLDETVEFLLQMGPTAAALRESSDASLVPRVTAAMREALAPYASDGGIRMESASWIVTARG